LVDCTTLYQVREPDSSGSGGTLTQAAHQWQYSERALSGGAILYGQPNATVEVVQDGSVALVTQIDRTVSAGAAFAPKLWFSHNGGPRMPLLDLLTTEGVAFFGAVNDAVVISGSVACCLAGALTPHNGLTSFTSADSPTYEACLGCSFVVRRVIKFSPAASGVYEFFEYDQNGTELNGGYPHGGARVEIVPMRMGVQ
jgi:hypothetical protein